MKVDNFRTKGTDQLHKNAFLLKELLFWKHFRLSARWGFGIFKFRTQKATKQYSQNL